MNLTELAITFVSGGLFSGLVLFLLRDNSDGRKTYIACIERCVIAANKFQHAYMSNFIIYAGVMRGDYSYNDALDMAIKEGAPHEEEIRFFSIMFPIYFPRIKSYYEKLFSMP